jgi:hypothetical protein
MNELGTGLGILGPIAFVVVIWLIACVRIVNEVEKNSTIVFPLPVELLRLMDRFGNKPDLKP